MFWTRKAEGRFVAQQKAEHGSSLHGEEVYSSLAVAYLRPLPVVKTSLSKAWRYRLDNIVWSTLCHKKIKSLTDLDSDATVGVL